MKRQQITVQAVTRALHTIDAENLLNAGVKIQIEYAPKTAEIKLLTVKTKKIHVENGNMEE